ncbi:MAG: hypothetical protein H8E81_02870 [Deltaproteobacteria bacterium]|nr:hypothetical protein [Deltaproteobacteria bacterium]
MNCFVEVNRRRVQFGDGDDRQGLSATEMQVSEGDIREWCRQKLANYRVPERFVIAKGLPLLPIGKIDKQTLRKMVADKKC